MKTKSCLACGRGLCEECPSPTVDVNIESGFSCCCGKTEDTEESVPFGSVDSGSTGKQRERRVLNAGDDVTISAGRKRAAELYELEPDAPCEWRALANCGGGLVPIVGCMIGKQQHRHHGPVKNTTYNSRKNIHKICTECHNQWHAKNNPVYDETLYATLPHDPRELTVVEIMERGARLK